MVSVLEKSPLMSAFDKNDMTPLDEPQAVRLKYRKVGNLQFISHLDLQDVLGRVLVRSGVPVWYTQGFNPHIKMVFSQPLPIGTQSVCEFLDIRVDRKITTDEIVRRLNAQLTDELRVERAYYPTSKFQDIAAVGYEIVIDNRGTDRDISEKIINLLTTAPLNMLKRSKSGEREVDILQYILGVDCKLDGDDIILKLKIRGGEGSLNPELVMTALREKLGLLPAPDDGYSIMRTALYFADGREFE